MTEAKGARLGKLVKEYNVGSHTIVDFLKKKGYSIEENINAKITPEMVEILEKEFSTEKNVKKESEKLNLKSLRDKKVSVSLEDENHQEAAPVIPEEEDEVIIKGTTSEYTHQVKIVGKMNLDPPKKKVPEKKEEVKAVIPETKVIVEEPVVEAPVIAVEAPISVVEEIVEKIESLPEIDVKVVGKIDLDIFKQKSKRTEVKKELHVPEIQPKDIIIESAPVEPQVEVQENAPKIEEVIEVIDNIVENIEVAESENDIEVEELVEKIVDSESNPVAEIIVPTEVIDENFIKTKFTKLSGPTVLGKMVLPVKDEKKKPVASSADDYNRDKKKKRKRIKVEQKVSVVAPPPGAKLVVNLDKNRASNRDNNNSTANKAKPKGPFRRPEVQEVDVQKQIKETLARLTAGKSKSKTSKYRRDKRDMVTQRQAEEMERIEQEKNILTVTEFITVSELASLMDIQPTQIISTCMSVGLFVSINQRLDAETIKLVTEEFNFQVDFTTVEAVEANEIVDNEEDLLHRPPIVTVMGHVDHGKTKLLDFIRKTNVIAGEAGGITQHIGAYNVKLEDGREITFLDTPGHEAFTAMRARGAKVTDIAIIVVAADDGVMPQTVEAINHAQAAGVPIVFAINKIDKPAANPEKIKEALANMNLLVEDWGGKYQSQEVSAITGLNVKNLLEKILLEAEMLELKANPDRAAKGTVIDSTLDKGRGYVATVLVQTGTLKTGDLILAGTNYGRVKALFNERGKKITEAGPSVPVLILGLNGAPQAGDIFNAMDDEREVKEIAAKREQLMREQSLRTMKHITLDEIGRRIAIGNFKELNIIVKGDVDGSVEALSDSLIKLSTEEIQINIIHKAVGQISESDVLLAAASNAIIVGFQVRPSMGARRLAEKEQIDIRLYSIIYSAIAEIKDAMEGMLSPEIKEEIVASLEVLQAFRITKVGTVAGCIVREGKIARNTRVRVIRDGIVIHTGSLGSLKRFKEDAKEVPSGMECGLNLNGFNDINEGDFIEGFKEVEVKKKL